MDSFMEYEDNDITDYNNINSLINFYNDEFGFNHTYYKMTKAIDYSYSDWPYDFKFIPVEYFSTTHEKVKELLNYCFQKNYVNKDDPKFQKFLADCICNMNTEPQFDMDVYEPGIRNRNNSIKTQSVNFGVSF